MSNVFFLPDSDWPTTNFLGMYCYFPVAPVTVVALLSLPPENLYHQPLR